MAAASGKKPERVGYDDVKERALYVLDLDAAEDLPAPVGLPSAHFACLLAWDARVASDAEIARLARWLLDSGAAYVCTWGPDCERVHDIIDGEAAAGDRLVDVNHVVMTTWHDADPLSEAIWFSLFCSWPAAAYETTCASTLGVAVGSKAWGAEIRAAFEDVRAFNTKVVGPSPRSPNEASRDDG
jgi:hypothetical protein